ncbi:acetyl-CoA synthetase [Halosegnis sp.]|uniref:acetyl-CoA synthetase n=1 Tax=Halosegnis sp. TaxID=2864959 RepID=UPI0035D3DB84
MSDLEFATLATLLARDRRSDAVALVDDAADREYDYRRALTTAWKAGLFFRNEGVRGGMRVSVADEPIPESILSFLGAGLLGAVVSFDAPVDAETKALVAPTGRLNEFDAGPETRQVGYGAEPTDPAVAYWERDVWSENPTPPPDRPAATDPLLATDGRTYSHGDLLGAARNVVDEHDIGVGDHVAVRASLTDPGVVAAGLLAPLAAGGVVVLRSERRCVFGVGAGPDKTTILPTDPL